MATDTPVAPPVASAPKFDKAVLDKDISWVGTRLREPSTYAGLAILLAAVGHFTLPAGAMNDITMIGTGIGGLIAILLPEGK